MSSAQITTTWTYGQSDLLSDSVGVNDARVTLEVSADLQHGPTLVMMFFASMILRSALKVVATLTGRATEVKT